MTFPPIYIAIIKSYYAIKPHVEDQSTSLTYFYLTLRLLMSYIYIYTYIYIWSS